MLLLLFFRLFVNQFCILRILSLKTTNDDDFIMHRYVHDSFGRVLQRTRSAVVAQLHVKVQSNRRRSPA